MIIFQTLQRKVVPWQVGIQMPSPDLREVLPNHPRLDCVELVNDAGPLQKIFVDYAMVGGKEGKEEEEEEEEEEVKKKKMMIVMMKKNKKKKNKKKKKKDNRGHDTKRRNAGKQRL